MTLTDLGDYAGAAEAFRAHGPNKFMADLYSLARQRLAARGVRAVYGGGFCTSDRSNSYQRRP